MAKYYYFLKVPLKLCTPSNAKRYLSEPGWLEKTVALRNNPKSTDSYILQSLKNEGQLDPLIVTWNGKEWVIEPGQGRWFCLYYLNIDTTFLLVKVEENEEQELAFKNHFKDYKYQEIHTYDEVVKIFKHSTIHSHTGLGYFRRRGWFMETKQTAGVIETMYVKYDSDNIIRGELI